jgi:hypothetical protein
MINGSTMAVTCACVNGSSNASDAALAETGKPLIPVIWIVACVVFSSPA